DPSTELPSAEDPRSCMLPEARKGGRRKTPGSSLLTARSLALLPSSARAFPAAG
ncbi:hypothetical protein P7K49_037704, partial [Saguinus oedipus]